MHAGVAAVLCFCGDNPAAGLALGFKESVSATAPCRHCAITAGHLFSFERSPASGYWGAMQAGRHILSRRPAGFNDLGLTAGQRSPTSCNRSTFALPPDLMHDELEGNLKQHLGYFCIRYLLQVDPCCGLQRTPSSYCSQQHFSAESGPGSDHRS